MKIESLYSVYCDLCRKEFDINQDRLSPDWPDRMDAVRAERAAVADRIACQPAGSLPDFARKAQVAADLTNGVPDDALIDARDLMAYSIEDDAIRLGLDPVPPRSADAADHHASIRAQSRPVDGETDEARVAA